MAKHGWSLEEGGNFVWEEEKGRRKRKVEEREEKEIKQKRVAPPGLDLAETGL